MAENSGDQQLFDVTPVERADRPAVPVAKTFRAFDPGQQFLLPPSLDEWLPEGHMARFVAQLIDEHMDLSRFLAAHTEKRGAPPYDPRVMLRIIVYGYAVGVRSSRKLEAACTDVVAFRWLAAGQAPDFRSIGRFRKRHLSAIGHLFTQVLALCRAAGMVQLGRVALDGTKVRANASRRKAMSYARMSETEKILAQQVSDLLAEAEAIDKTEDAEYGADKRGDELPAELATRQGRLAKIREAKEALEDEAAARAEKRSRDRSASRGDDDAVTEAKAAKARSQAAPRPKAQRNFTDRESRIMKTSDGSFHQCFNAQAVVDAEHQVIVATDVGDNAADVNTFDDMFAQTLANTEAAPGEFLADAGYCSADNLAAAGEANAKYGTEFFIATGRQKHGEPAPIAPRGRIPKTATAKQRMARKLKTKAGHHVYSRRKVIVEPVFGQMHTVQNAKYLLLRGMESARGEWLLHAACHNLRKLWQNIGTEGLPRLIAT